jgi:catalase
MSGSRPVTTTDADIPAPSDEYSLPADRGGPLRLQDHYLVQKMAQFNRERVPGRVVHAKGGGAYGVLEITEDRHAAIKRGDFPSWSSTRDAMPSLRKAWRRWCATVWSLV